MDISSAKKVLEDAGFKLTEKLVFQGNMATLFDPATYAGEVSYIVINDTETTGVSANAEIIQIACYKFALDRRTGEVLGLADKYVEFNEPALPITPEITDLTGITNEMVAGKKLDYERLNQFFADEDLLMVAHSAQFDRMMMEQNLHQHVPNLIGLPWCCSLQEVDWATGSEKLDYLLYKHGRHFEAHQAHHDVEALAFLLFEAEPLDGGQPYYRRLIESAQRITYDLYAAGAVYDAKDILKGAGYKWSDGTTGAPKAWHIVVDEEGLQKQLAWLQEKVSSCRPHIVEESACERYAHIKPQPTSAPTP